MTFTIFTTLLIFLTLLTLNYNYGFASKMTIHHSKHPTLKHFNKVNEESHGKGALSVIKSVYVTSIEIGHQQLFLVFDTGSHFTWVQWENCRVCLPKEPPIIAPYHKTDDYMPEYCNGPYGDLGRGNNCKHRQDESQIYGDYKTAPLIDGGYFYLTILSGISVIGRGIVPIDSPSNIIIDTGTTLTYLEDSPFNTLVSMIKDLVDDKFDDFPIVAPYLSDLDLELSYEKPYQIEIVIVLGDAYIHIDDPQKVWLKFSEYAYCLSFKRNGKAPHSILGSYHIRGYKVVYDLNPKNPTIQVSTGQEETGCFTPVTA